MYCKHCGKQLPDNSAFCFHCGTQQATPATPSQAPPAPPVMPPITDAESPANAPAEPAPQYTLQASQTVNTAVPAAAQKSGRKRNILALIFAAVSVLLAAALLLSFLNILPSPFGASAAASGSAFASRSFDTPEEAIESFVEYLKAGDYGGALSTCAINNMASGFDFEYSAERLKVVLPAATSNMPSEYPQYILYNEYKNAREILMQMICFAISFHLSDENKGLIDGTPIYLKTDEFPAGLIEELDPAVLSSLQIAKIAKTGLHDDEKNRENQKKQAKVYGADDVQFRSVLYNLDGDYYVGGFTLIEFDGKWQIQSMTDPLIGISAFGTPIPVSGKSEFEGMLG